MLREPRFRRLLAATLRSEPLDEFLNQLCVFRVGLYFQKQLEVISCFLITLELIEQQRQLPVRGLDDYAHRWPLKQLRKVLVW